MSKEQLQQLRFARTLQHLHHRYRSAAGYLAEIGLSSEEIQALQRKLIGE